ncbi:MAG: hypothetical protein L0287_08670, partial [Anaerolineae bacterium]|nr:hypothetical protein [Anaerolineae bacterium]
LPRLAHCFVFHSNVSVLTTQSMRLKIIFFPLALITVLILVIWHIQPEWQMIRELQTKNAQKEADLEKVNAKLNHLQILTQALASHVEQENIVSRYLPTQESHDRVIDAVNVLATTAGLQIFSMNLDRIVDARDLEASLAVPILDEQGNPLPPVVPEPSPRFVKVDATLIGGYPNIRDFVGKMYQSDIYHSFSVMRVERAPSSDASTLSNNDVLQAKLTMHFGYMPLADASLGSTSTVFETSTLNFAQADALKSWITQPIPLITPPPGGRDNPFVK